MRKRLIYSLTLLFLLFAAGAGLTMLHIYRVTTNLQSVINLHRVEIIRQNLVIDLQTVQSNLYASGTSFGVKSDVLVDHVNALNDSVRRCSGCHHTREMMARLKELNDNVGQYKQAISQMSTATAQRERIEGLKTTAVRIGDTLLARTREMAFIADKSLTLRTVGALRGISNSKTVLLGTIVLSFFIALTIAITLTRQITKPVFALVDATRMIAAGRLGFKTSYDDASEFGELARQFNAMSEQLKNEHERIVSVAMENAQLSRHLQDQMIELRETHEQLVQSAKLAAIGELASNIAHEINNPLTSIIGFTEILKDEEDVAAIKSRLDIIEKESLRARDIVRQLLQFARKRDLELVEIDVNDVVKEVTPLVEAGVKSSGVTLRADFGELPKTIGDPNQLKQVVINIVTNALSAMTAGGALSIRTARLGEYIVMDFSDTGPGIPKTVLPHIFEPFFTTKKEKGTGLGLSISYRIIQDHGGRIDVESSEGEGATFSIRLPVRSSLA